MLCTPHQDYLAPNGMRLCYEVFGVGSKRKSGWGQGIGAAGPCLLRRAEGPSEAKRPLRRSRAGPEQIAFWPGVQNAARFRSPRHETSLWSLWKLLWAGPHKHCPRREAREVCYAGLCGTGRGALGAPYSKSDAIGGGSSQTTQARATGLASPVNERRAPARSGEAGQRV